jgi:rod shape-determining protein MreC
VAKNYKTTLLVFIVAAIISYLISISASFRFPKKITLDFSNLPLRLISLSFVPVESVINCNRSLREAARLKQENQILKISLMELKDAKEENERLKKILSFKDDAEFSLVAAKVIASDVSNFRKTVVIDKGGRHGIKLGNPAITVEGIVGVIVEVGNFASRVILINDPDFSMAAKVRRPNTSGVVSGSLEGVCKLKYLDLEDDIKIGDEIVSLGMNSRFPAGLYIGKVIRLSKDSSGLSLVAIVKPKVRLSSIQEVLVIINY